MCRKILRDGFDMMLCISPNWAQPSSFVSDKAHTKSKEAMTTSRLQDLIQKSKNLISMRSL